jgi:hypothetical protein
MTCPSCGEQVADGVAICPKCDAVVDPTMFDTTPPEEDGPTKPVARPLKGGPPGAKKKRSTTGANPAIRKTGNTGTKPAVKKERAGGMGMPEAPVRKVREAPEPRPDWRVKDEPRLPPAPTGQSGYHMVDPEDFWGEVKSFVSELTLPDKLAFIGAFSAMIACFFPWKDTITDGEVLGLMSLGAAVFGVTVVIIIAIIIRVRKVMPALHALIPWLIQFGGSCFCIVWCLVYIKLALDTTMARSPIGNFERYVSSPSAGVVIALLMSVVMLAGTLMGLKEKPR